MVTLTQRLARGTLAWSVLLLLIALLACKKSGAGDESSDDDTTEDKTAADDSAKDDSAKDDSAKDDSAKDDSAKDDSAPVGQFKAGDPVDVEWKGDWWKADVTKVRSGPVYYVHYVGWGNEWDEWVAPARIRGRTSGSRTN
jgi:hypothetical protein